MSVSTATMTISRSTFGKIMNGRSTRRRTTKPAAFDPTDKYAVTGVGAP